MNHYPKNGYMGDIEPSNNTLRKTRHTRGTLLSYRIGLDPVATSYLVGSIERTRNIPSNCITHHKKEPPVKLYSEMLRQRFRLGTSLETNRCYLH